LDSEDVKSQSLEAIWNLSKENKAILTWYQIIGHKGPVLSPRSIRTTRAWTQLLI